MSLKSCQQEEEISIADTLCEIKEKLKSHEKRIVDLENRGIKELETVEKQMSLKEFILSKNPDSEHDKTLLLGYYLEKYRNVKRFNASELKTAFEQAKERIPRNINFQAIQNVKRGFLAESEEKKDNRVSWYVTRSGEHYVETKLPKK